MKKLLLGVLVGLIIGWATIGIASAESKEVKGYMNALRKILSIMEEIQVTSKITADNTTAIRKKLGE